MRLQVNDFMTTPVVTAESTATVGELRRMMKRHGIHAIPITEHTPNTKMKLLGIITSTDLCKDFDDENYIHDVMQEQKVHVIASNLGAQAAAACMLKHGVHHLVVMEDGELVGMISSQDFVRLMTKFKLKPKKRIPV